MNYIAIIILYAHSNHIEVPRDIIDVIRTHSVSVYVKTKDIEYLCKTSKFKFIMRQAEDRKSCICNHKQAN